MLKDLFPKVFRRYESSDFGAELEAFAHWLHATGYIRAAIRRHVYRLRCVLEASLAPPRASADRKAQIVPELAGIATTPRARQ